jgi:Tfp pilus assembly major pilin PilA
MTVTPHEALVGLLVAALLISILSFIAGTVYEDRRAQLISALKTDRKVLKSRLDDATTELYAAQQSEALAWKQAGAYADAYSRADLQLQHAGYVDPEPETSLWTSAEADTQDWLEDYIATPQNEAQVEQIIRTMKANTDSWLAANITYGSAA